MREIISIDGPVIGRKVRSARITVKFHKSTCSVRWDVGGIDISGAASDKFSERCQQSSMMEEISAWWKRNLNHFCNRSHLFGCVRWGSVKFIPPEYRLELVQIIRKHFEPAALNLPTRYFWNEHEKLSE